MSIQRPALYECQFIKLSDVLNGDEYETMSGMLTNDFTWGDTRMAMVNCHELLVVLERKIKSSGLPRDPDREAAVQKVREAIDMMGDSVYIDLY